MTTAFIFPGQGAQAVGMGADAYHGSPAARAVFEEADSVLGVPLSRLILDGPADELVRSLNAQPAILCVSIAMLRAAEERLGTAMPRPAFTAGHSVGEYAALVAGGALSLAEALRLVRTRGELMQAACDATPSGMAALIGLPLEPARHACEGTGAQVANVNSAEQIVLGGPNDALEHAIANAKEAGARRAIPLDVAGAFHTEVMRPAEESMAGVLAQATLSAPAVPVVANTTALPIVSAEDVRSELLSQLCGCVYWQHSVELMAAQGVDRFVEFGPGKVLSGLSRRIVADADALAVSDLDAVTALA
ncbi:MAG: ACP S-malonyltransferase [Chloroflexota bacterium]|nr:ACP S-malonyltransferase [Chloroflexota bacterium]MDE2885484.1 ACP S-malonyltransferase [Chloroflexota bacterium]